MHSLNYSAVIRTKDSARTIRACIESLLAQEAPPEEIIIVDSGSSDATLEIVSEFEICRVFHYPDEPFNYSKSLNQGIREATHGTILILSSHCIFTDPQSTRLMSGFIETNEMAIAATLVVSRIKKRTKRCKPKNVTYRVINRSNFKGHAMDNPCAMIRKIHWEQRAFNEQMERCEDQEWAHYWIQKSNYFSVMIDRPRIFYDKEFDPQKIAKDFVTINRQLHRYHGSVFHIVRLFGSMILHPDRFLKYGKLILFLIYYKIFDRKV